MNELHYNYFSTQNISCYEMYRDYKEKYINYSRNRRPLLIYFISPFWLFSIIFVPSLSWKLIFTFLYLFNIYSTRFGDHLRDLHTVFGFPQHIIMADFPPIILYRESIINIIKYICSLIVLILLIINLF